MIKHNRDSNLFEVNCDRCSSSYEQYDCDFGWQSMIDDLKEDGWSIRGRDGDWTHICPYCREKELEGAIEGEFR